MLCAVVVCICIFAFVCELSVPFIVGLRGCLGYCVNSASVSLLIWVCFVLWWFTLACF